MSQLKWNLIAAACVALIAVNTGCMHMGYHGFGSSKSCDSCQGYGGCDVSCGDCDECGGCGNHWSSFHGYCLGHLRSHAIPEMLPLGSVPRAHYQAMETNGEAMDFIIYRRDFVGKTAELSPDGKDKILEIAARMRSAPFPVLIERQENNSDPELDAYRRNLVAQVLTDLGNPDADQRTIVSTPYGNGYNSIEGEFMYFRHILTGGNNNNFGNNGGFGGGGGGFGGGF